MNGSGQLREGAVLVPVRGEIHRREHEQHDHRPSQQHSAGRQTAMGDDAEHEQARSEQQPRGTPVVEEVRQDHEWRQRRGRGAQPARHIEQPERSDEEHEHREEVRRLVPDDRVRPRLPVAHLDPQVDGLHRLHGGRDHKRPEDGAHRRMRADQDGRQEVGGREIHERPGLHQRFAQRAVVRQAEDDAEDDHAEQRADRACHVRARPVAGRDVGPRQIDDRHERQQEVGGLDVERADPCEERYLAGDRDAHCRHDPDARLERGGR